MEKVLSKSPIRDPFQMASEKKEGREQKLSSTEIRPPNPAEALNKPEDFKPILEKLGISHDGISLNDLGKVQLAGRLRAKLGDFQSNPEAIKALEAFNKHIAASTTEGVFSLKESISGANRTLAALFGGSK